MSATWYIHINMYTALIFSARNDLSTVGKHFVIGV